MTPTDLQGLADSLQAAKDYADAIVKPPLEQLGGLLADTVGYWRLRNRVNLLLKAKQYLEERGVEPTTLLPNLFVPLVDEAGNTDDQTLAEMFARLLATHLDAGEAGKVHPSFAKTLGQLSALDVKILRVIDVKDEHNWNHRKEPKQQAMCSEPFLVDEARKRWGVTAEEAQLSLANLRRLGLCEVKELDEPDFAGVYPRDYQVTEYGQRLQAACSKPGTYWRHAFDGKVEQLYGKFFNSAGGNHRSAR